MKLLVGDSAAPIARPRTSRSTRQAGRLRSPAWRGLGAALALSMTLSGASPCLCAAEPAKTADPHACCSHGGNPSADGPTDALAMKTAVTACCTSPSAVTVGALVVARDGSRQEQLSAEAPAPAAQRPSTVVARGVLALSLPLASPPRPTVLRI